MYWLHYNIQGFLFSDRPDGSFLKTALQSEYHKTLTLLCGHGQYVDIRSDFYVINLLTSIVSVLPLSGKLSVTYDTPSYVTHLEFQ